MSLASMPSNALAKKPFLLALFSGGGGVVAKTLINTITIPVLLTTQGSDGFGLYVLLISLLEVVLMLELGFDAALIKLFMDLRKRDTAGYAFLLKSAHGLYGVTALAVLGCGALLSASKLGFFHVPNELASVAQQASLLIALEAALTLYLGYYRSILMSHGALQWINGGELLSFVLAPAIGLWVLLAGYGFIPYMCVRLAMMMGRCVLVILQALRHEPSDKRPILHLDSFMQMFKLGIHGMVINVSVLVSHKLDNVIIASFLPLKSLGVFEIVFRFLGVALRVGSKLCEGLLAVFTHLANHPEDGDAQKTAQSYFLRMSSLNLLTASLLCLLVIWYYPILFAWVSRDHIGIEDTWPIVWVAIPIVISGCLQMPATQFLFSSGHHRFLTKTSVVAAASNLILSIVLIHPLGLLGVALGTLIPQLIQHQGYLIRKTLQALQIDGLTYVRIVYGHVASAVLAAILVLLAARWVFQTASQFQGVEIVVMSCVTTAVAMAVWASLMFPGLLSGVLFQAVSPQAPLNCEPD
ncbi:MAG: polysaccharide biosynthesis C-terminal domain-containing protein [Vampirovibrionales bacterium]|nr:polysaccharide biosynthesis C-terminal domain-containing protein [Vampirovibrionales bacterium]